MLNKITSFVLLVLALVSFASSQEKLVKEIMLEGSAKDKSLEIIREIDEGLETIEVNFYVNFAPDVHEVDDNLPTGITDGEELIEKSSKEQALEFIIFISIIGVFFVGIELIKSDDE